MPSISFRLIKFEIQSKYPSENIEQTFTYLSLDFRAVQTRDVYLSIFSIKLSFKPMGPNKNTKSDADRKKLMFED